MKFENIRLRLRLSDIEAQILQIDAELHRPLENGSGEWELGEEGSEAQTEHGATAPAEQRENNSEGCHKSHRIPYPHHPRRTHMRNLPPLPSGRRTRTELIDGSNAAWRSL
jgi:hypothetical protein